LRPMAQRKANFGPISLYQRLGSPSPLLDPNSDTSASVESHEIQKWA